ncbi:uncharacterized protein UV8b_01048 [Ustilaginoidea virens]|uniref:Uncharacterized protein n=1 Tax=Ustilaginoidea virens TaxID=1159556 RepID=A0A8E5MEW6_USTVR|nr:uncharacterized protein UV8b_01048 [Ustilaginoidea virens]QUC16807.1 hypothetical protein UV8b_01048 [Ustilaginoidea virens]
MEPTLEHLVAIPKKFQCAVDCRPQLCQAGLIKMAAPLATATAHLSETGESTRSLAIWAVSAKPLAASGSKHENRAASAARSDEATIRGTSEAFARIGARAVAAGNVRFTASLTLLKVASELETEPSDRVR